MRPRLFYLTKGNRTMMKERQNVKPQVTVQEAGRRGGERTKERYGSANFEKIGRKGGSATYKKHGVEHYKRMRARVGKK